MIPNTYFAVLNQQVSALPIQVDQVEGYFKGAANQWLQLHDSCITPATGAVPIWEIPIAATAQFFENLQVAHLNLIEGVFIGVSTTEGTWTAATGANTMDIIVWTDVIVPTTTVVGDKTTSVTSLQVWSEATGAAGQKKLHELIVTEKSSTASYILVYADDTPSNNDPAVVLAQYPLASGATVKLSFSNFTPQDKSLTNATLRLGCTVLVGYSTVAGKKYGAVNGGLYGIGAPVTATNATILAVTN